jgi:hypothetical protein
MKLEARMRGGVAQKIFTKTKNESGMQEHRESSSALLPPFLPS